MRKIASSLLFSLAVIGLFLAQIDLASSFGFRRFDPSGGFHSSPSNPSPQPSPSPSGFVAKDPGVRAGADSGNPIAGLTPNQLAFFNAGKTDFAATEDVADGLGPRMNLDSCGGCHAQPAVGGSSPAVNPQVAFASRDGGTDALPSFIRRSGPVREARFVRNSDGTPDGGVHAIFTITGRTGATGCTLAQPNFAAQLSSNNVIFRTPTPTFGIGLMEMIPDSAIIANQSANSTQKASLGINGRVNFQVQGRTISGQTNNNGNDGTVARFGWKAQNKSALLFSGEAYNVEMGISNDIFQTEREENPACQFAPVPNDVQNMDAATPLEATTAIQNFSNFMRFLAPPMPSTTVPGGATSITRGRQLFSNVGCALCHTPSFTTSESSVAALSKKPVNLFSDLLVHDMGPGLADGVSQGQAGPTEFRSAPLWGLGQRIFFLHDGRTTDLVQAIEQHRSGSALQNNASEANGVIGNFNNLGEGDKQDLLNFLRSL
ncbi:MAG TPA: di-heme oxidoredictase family protein [Burkholderiales bacterium]|nr:di-heme oxidoredictase family protein [Burkholderiales bacterium]